MFIFSNIPFVKSLACLLPLLSVSFLAHSASADPCLAFIAQNNRIVKEIALNVSDALTAAHICHTIDYFPEKRADFLFKQEKYDGFLMRDALFRTRSPIPVMKIDPVLIQTNGVILSRDADVKKIADLNGRSIGIVRGWLWMEMITQEYPRVVKASKIIDLVSLLHEKRVDSLLIVEELVPILKLDGYSCEKIIQLEGHIFLKETSKEFAEAISQALKNHLESGKNFVNIRRLINSFSSRMSKIK